MQIKTISLTSELSIHQLGFGTYLLKGDDALRSVRDALEAGYRSIDTATLYENEREIGIAIKDSGIPRNELKITTKLWNDFNSPEQVRPQFEQSLERLGTDYVDLYLMHWPVKKSFVRTWETIAALPETGLVRAVGVCNFHQHHFESLQEAGLPKPCINQIELHPFFPQSELVAYCENQGIAVESWAPIMQGDAIRSETIDALARKYNKSLVQIILRWHIDRGFIVIPRSRQTQHIKDNIDIFDFSLTAEEVDSITALDCGKRYGPDPDTFA